MDGERLFWLHPPYHHFRSIDQQEGIPAHVSAPGSVIVWNVDAADPSSPLELVRRRPPGVSLVVMLPPTGLVPASTSVLEIVERCRPQSILPHHPDLDAQEVSTLLRRPPDDLGGELTDYLHWRGIKLETDTARMVRRVVELSAELRTVTALARALYMSRRALGRRFLSRGLPVPSHWLQMGRILRAVIRLQNSSDSLFTVACSLGYPDGFSLSNQMKRLTGHRPSLAREALGWEWVVENWLCLERDEGGLKRPMWQWQPTQAET